MSDANLLMFGCAVSFLAAAGLYLIAREGFLSRRGWHKRARRKDAGIAA